MIGLAALCAAVLIAIQLGVTYWFYLYIPWFFAPAIIALLGRFDDGRQDRSLDARAAAPDRAPVDGAAPPAEPPRPNPARPRPPSSHSPDPGPAAPGRRRPRTHDRPEDLQLKRPSR